MLTQHTQSVVDSDYNHFTITGQNGAIVGISTIPLKGLAM